MHTLPSLNYDYDALEQIIDAKTMEVHHSKHHQAYIDKLNIALNDYPDLMVMDIERLLSLIDELPEPIRKVVRNNGGGHYNHSLFWRMMRPLVGEGAVVIKQELVDALEKYFGGVDNFKQEFTNQSLGVFGSGWCWLVKRFDGSLGIEVSSNQDNPIINATGKPILGLDLWEHAYYLRYQNRRAEYVQAWWSLIDWDYVYSLYK